MFQKAHRSALVNLNVWSLVHKGKDAEEVIRTHFRSSAVRRVARTSVELSVPSVTVFKSYRAVQNTSTQQHFNSQINSTKSRRRFIARKHPVRRVCSPAIERSVKCPKAVHQIKKQRGGEEEEEEEKQHQIGISPVYQKRCEAHDLSEQITRRLVACST
ncbi:hypothetical protein F2P81_021410 [Scophthalmus maximus]|uniref:Uncharacterized protein n=1 Tax=Scophthalmus maximus TaxID=52904 RepID=A0A6A4RX34_SCOMX|nr:hypothetical protein F2P81_021410 [Scophthalmus maximus]